MTETMVLLRYVMAASRIVWRPAPEVVERFEAACRAQLAGDTHRLDPLVLRHPFLLGGLDCWTRIRFRQSPLAKKLLIAAAIMECDPVSADWLLPRNWNRWQLTKEGGRLFGRLAMKGTVALGLACAPRFVRRNVGVPSHV